MNAVHRLTLTPDEVESIEMTHLDMVWCALAISLTVVLILLIALLAVLIPMWSDRQRRRDEAVGHDLEARRAQFPDGVLEAVLESNLTGGRISPETVQRFIDRGWLDPR